MLLRKKLLTPLNTNKHTLARVRIQLKEQQQQQQSYLFINARTGGGDFLVLLQGLDGRDDNYRIATEQKVRVHKQNGPLMNP